MKVFTEMLSLVNPSAFGRAFRIKQYVRHIATQLDLPAVWELKFAAMLSQIGCVTLTPNDLEKVYAGFPLARDELKMFSEHPETGAELLKSILRLENIAAMIRLQLQRRPLRREENDLQTEDRIALGGQVTS